jgi:hypothetical protein
MNFATWQNEADSATGLRSKVFSGSQDARISAQDNTHILCSFVSTGGLLGSVLKVLCFLHGTSRIKKLAIAEIPCEAISDGQDQLDEGKDSHCEAAMPARSVEPRRAVCVSCKAASNVTVPAHTPTHAARIETPATM